MPSVRVFGDKYLSHEMVLTEANVSPTYLREEGGRSLSHEEEMLSRGED